MYYALVLSFVFSTSVCFIIDYFKLLKKYKMQDEMRIYKDALPCATFNIICLSLPLLYVQDSLITYRNKWFIEYPVDLYVYYHIYAGVFYLTHRILHIPYLYRFSHKTHHRYKYPNASGAFYAHWFDYYITNLLPAFVGFVLLKPTLIEAQFAITISIMNTVIISHGGYTCFSSFHHDHHKTTTYNYGLEDQIDKKYNTKLLSA